MEPLASLAQPAPGPIVERPDPGTLARGVWEAPGWAFYAAAAVVVLAALLYTARRAGLFRRWRSRR